MRIDIQVAHKDLQSDSEVNTLSVCEALAVVEPHKLPVPVTNCHESHEDIESFRCRTRELCGIGTPIGEVRFAYKDERGPCVPLSLFGDTVSTPGTIFL